MTATETRNIHFKMKEARSTLIFNLSDVDFGYIPLKTFVRLQNLQHLYLNKCSIRTQPPSSLIHFTNLVTLDLSHNSIQQVPDDFFNLHFQQLKKLNLSYNRLNLLPNTIRYLVSIETLLLSNNSLVEIVSEIGELQSLKMLDVANNLIREISGSLCAGGLSKNLKYLNLSGNLLHTLPIEIGLLVKIEELSIERNQLVYLPASVRSLVKLKAFYYGGNEWAICAPTLKGVPTTNQASFGPLALEKNLQLYLSKLIVSLVHK